MSHAFIVPPSSPAAFDRLDTIIQLREGNTEEILAVTRSLRRALEDAFKGRELTEGSLLLERKKRLRHKLDHLDGHLINRDWDAAAAHLPGLREQYFRILQEAGALASAPQRLTRGRTPAGWRNVPTVARKEAIVILQSVQGLVLFGLMLLTLGVGLEAAIGTGSVAGVRPSVQLVWTYAHSLDFLTVPLAGILLGYGLLNEERTSGTIHFLATKPVSRGGIVLGKWIGMAAALATLVGVSATIVGSVAYATAGELGDPGAVVGYVLSLYLLALSFASFALLASATLDRGAAALGAGIGAFVLLGPVWQNAFLVKELKALGASPSAVNLLAYLASPFTAWWNWTSQMLGARSDVSGLPVGEPWHAALVDAVERGTREGLPFYASEGFYAFVLLAWCGLALGAAVLAFRSRDLG